jgi:hypothetical protein
VLCRTALPLAITFVFLGLLLPQVAEAARKRIDKDTMKLVREFVNDRESRFSGGDARTTEEAEALWRRIASRVDSLYLDEEVKISTFGTGATTRQGLTHLIYLAFECQRKKHTLDPPPEKLVAGHPFLQELVIKGTCYTKGETFPKKIKDLLATSTGSLALLRLHLDSWDKKHRQKFEKTYPME